MGARLVALAALLLGNPAVAAQPTLGARASVLSTWVTVESRRLGIVDFDALLGGGVSVFAETGLAPGVAAGLEFGLTQAGFASNGADATEPNPDPSALTYDTSTRATYLSLAPTVTGRLPGVGVRLYVAVGPRLDLLVVERSRIDALNVSTDDYDRVAVGVGGALGVAVPVGRREVRADVRASTTQPLGDSRQATVELRVGATL